MLAALSRFCYRHRWVVVLTWIVALFALNVISKQAGNAYSQNFRLPAADSQQAQDLLTNLPNAAEASFISGQLVFKADQGINDPAIKARLEQLFTDVAAVPGVTGVGSPYADTPRAKAQVSADGTIGVATVQFAGTSSKDVPKSSLDQITKLVDDAEGNGLQIELGGAIFQGQGSLPGTELIGLVAAMIILLIAFGSIIAMGLPILTALFGIGVGFSVVALLAHVTSVPEFSTQLAAMIGIGVGIDYALFIVTRYREGRATGLSGEQSVVAAIDTAGRAVLFAGTTVVISLAGMLLIGIEFIQGLGLSAASVVAVTMVASLTLLPSLLAMKTVERYIDRLGIPGLKGPSTVRGQGLWYRWSRFLQAHPWPFAIAGFAVLILLALPVLSMRLGSSDASNLPTTSTTRRAYDLNAEAFGPGASAPLLLAAEVPAGTDPAALTKIVTAVSQDPDVARATPAGPPTNGVAVLQVIPKTSGQDAATSDLIQRLRTDVLPQATAGTGITVHVGGVTAIFDDLAAQLQTRLPVFIGVVLGLSFLLLLVVFRSVVVPLKAVIMNLLSIGAAYGVIVAVFQKGWGASLFGVGNTGPIESFVPMMMFAILFGLSMDYEVFLLSRIKEEYDRTGDNATAVADGLSMTARVITAAALIMVTVFGSFVFGDNRVIKMFGLGLSVAVLIDASIVRMILVPATMELLGDANWWFPKWLRWLPTIHVEGHELPVPEGQPVGADADIDRELAELLEGESRPDPTN